MDPLSISLDQCIALLAEEKKGRRRTTATVLRELGTPPGKEVVLKILNGRYGPYVTDGETNASLPRGTTPEQVTIEQAVDLLAERASAPKRPRRRRKAA
jgi:DNA topoisomerase-1